MVTEDDIKTVEEVRSELLLAHGLLQVFVAGRQEADVQLDGSRSTDADKFTFLKYAQQLGLERKREFSHFIEEDTAALGDLQEALFLANGAGEGTLFVAEELAFKECLGKRGAVQRDERLFFARTILVDGACGEFFAGATLAVDQHGGVAGGHTLDELVDVAHARALADHIVLQADLGAELPILDAQMFELSGVFDGDCGQAGDRGEQLEVVARERGGVIFGVEIYDTKRLVGGNQWHAKNRVCELAFFGIRRNTRIRCGTFIFDHGNAFLDHATSE